MKKPTLLGPLLAALPLTLDWLIAFAVIATYAVGRPAPV
jgi:hypothetical protein